MISDKKKVKNSNGKVSPDIYHSDTMKIKILQKKMERQCDLERKVN